MFGIFKKDHKTTRYPLGIVLSGGGTRGFAHLGVLKALEENNIKPEIISGVSAGSIVGALYADGYKPEEILKELTSHKLLNYLDFSIPKTGLVKMSGFEKTLKKMLRAKNFEDLKIPLKVFAVNMNTAEYTCFEKGPVAIAVKASSSIPVIFPPVEIDGEEFTDGGVINNFPVEALQDICDKIIGVSVNPLGERKNLDSLKKIAERTFQLTIRSHTLERKDKCDLFIEPEGLDDYGLLDLSSAHEIFDLGYESALKSLEKNQWLKE
ncbi:MAG: patatin-like phospholipase family protein [Bacteroidales bacterium]